MKLRIFLTSTSSILAAWMLASYQRELPVDSHFYQGISSVQTQLSSEKSEETDEAGVSLINAAATSIVASK